EVAVTTDLANDELSTGWFTLWRAQDVMVYRYGLTLAGGAVATGGQIDAMLRDAVQACERFYPAFQLAAFDDVAPEDAVAVAIGESFGRA
ncbi:MAG: YbjN domain-containing protein, partial [Rubrimonas sp.]